MKQNNKVVAVKISKNEKSESENAQIEGKLLRRIAKNDPHDNNLIEVYDSFMFRQHFCIVTEILDINLYNYITQHRETGMPRDLLRNVA